MRIASFINHQILSSSSEFNKLNPFTGQILHQVSSCDMMGLVTAIQSSNKAFQDYKTSAIHQRRDFVLKIKKNIEENILEYSRLEALDQGLPLWVARKYNLDNVLKNIDKLLSLEPSSADKVSPVGVIALITSWNFSLRVVLERLVPALLAGNSVIVKVSIQSPITAHILTRIITAADLPPGLVNIIVTDDPDVKKMLIQHPGVKAVSLVGRLETSQSCIQAASQNSLQSFKKIQISSGSKNSAFVLGEPTNDIFEDVMASFLIGQGQMCWNSTRLFVLEKNELEWQLKIEEYLAMLKPSESIEDNSLWTPTLKKSSFEKFNEIQKTALDDQAKLIKTTYQLKSDQSQFYLPPIFTKDMSQCSTLQQDQIHSPFFILSAVKYAFDIPKYSNVSYFGFAAHLWGDAGKLQKISEGLDVGLIKINGSSFEVVGAQLSVKQSGYGLQDFSPYGDFYSNQKRIIES